MNYSPKNPIEFNNMLEGIDMIFQSCAGLDEASVVYGSVAYAFYTMDTEITIGDVDVIVSESWFDKIIDSVKNNSDFEVQLSKDHSLRVFYKGQKISFHGAEHHTPESLRYIVKGEINGVKIRFINDNLLARLYAESAQTGQENKQAEYKRKIQKLKLYHEAKKPKLIIVNGPGAVGKTTLTNRLCEELPQPCVRINIDEIRHMITARKQFPEISYPLARKLARGILHEALSDRRDVVIDKMLFDEPSYDDIGCAVDVYRKIALKNNAEIFEFALMATKETLMERAKQRGFRADGSVTPDTVLEFHSSMEEFLYNRHDVNIIHTDKLNDNEVFHIVWDMIHGIKA